MCGIVAMLGVASPIPEAALTRATAALRHRGPDGSRTWVSSDRAVGLGHTRLSIIDPEAEQPIASEDGRVRVVANGEFYGFEETRRRLERRGHRFRTGSDSEIALHLWESEGTGCVDSLRGEFAFIIWDEARRTLFAARDRFGIKPLFYCEAGGVLSLASEAKAFFAGGFQARWDEDALFHTLHASPPEDRALFAGIRQIPPGHFFIFREGVCRLQRYWDPPLRARSHTRAPSLQESVARVRTLVKEAVELRLRADVPVGCLLSGGIDSSSVLALAAAHGGAPIPAFTIAFDQPNYDESAAAAEMARHVGAEHIVVPVSDAEMADHFGRATWHGEMVQYNAHGTARYLLSRAIRDAGYRSVLGGEGADELFLGYAFLRAALPSAALGGRAGRWLKLAARLLRSPRRSYPHLSASSPWLARVATVLDPAPALAQRLEAGVGMLRSVLSPDYLRSKRDADVYRALYARCDERRRIWSVEPVRLLRYLWFRSIFPGYHLAADRLDMAHGVEVRLPFLDHVLVEYGAELPIPLLAAGPQEKFVLREAVRPFVPESAYGRTKQPFWAPPSVTRKGSRLYELTQDTLRGDRLAAVPFFEPRAVVRLLDRAEALTPIERSPLEPLLIMMLSICMLDEGMRGVATVRTESLEIGAVPNVSTSQALDGGEPGATGMLPGPAGPRGPGAGALDVAPLTIP